MRKYVQQTQTSPVAVTPVGCPIDMKNDAFHTYDIHVLARLIVTAGIFPKDQMGATLTGTGFLGISSDFLLKKHFRASSDACTIFYRISYQGNLTWKMLLHNSKVLLLLQTL